MHQEVTVSNSCAINSYKLNKIHMFLKETISDLMPEIKSIFEKYIKDDV